MNNDQDLSINAPSWGPLGEMKCANLCASDLSSKDAVNSEVKTSEVLGTFTFRNRFNKTRLQWARASLPLKKGEFTDAESLKAITVDHHASIGRYPIKWHLEEGKKHSVAVAGMIIPVLAEPGQVVKLNMVKNAQGVVDFIPYGYGENVSWWLGWPNNQVCFYAILRSGGQTYYANYWNNPQVLENSERHLSVRYHTNFVNTQTQEIHPLSFSAYSSLYQNQDFGEMVVSFGNQTFKKVVEGGGIQVDSLELYMLDPFRFDVRNPGAYQAQWISDDSGYKRIQLIQNRRIGDGQAWSFRGTWSIFREKTGIFYDSCEAEKKYPLHGICDMKAWEDSEAAGNIGRIMKPRANYTQAQMYAELESKAESNTQVWVDATYYPQHYSRQPGITGDQSHFCGNIANDMLQALWSQSDAPIIHYLHNMQVATYRPSYYFYQNRRMNWFDTPASTWFWSGKIHYHPSQNEASNPWSIHYVGKNLQNSYEWFGEDDQHFGETHLRHAYELTGDCFAKDLLEYRMTLTLWNKLGDGNQRGFYDSERAVRTSEDALQLLRYFPDGRVSEALKERLKRRLAEIHKAQSDYAMSTYGFAGWEYIYNHGGWPISQGTTPGAVNINGQPFEQNGVISTWWTGFHLCWLALMAKYMGAQPEGDEIIRRYMNVAQKFYFDENGLNEGHHRVHDWNNPVSAPFTQAWHAGWIEAFLYAKPKGLLDQSTIEFFESKMIPLTRSGIETDNSWWTAFSNSDRWWM